MKIHIELITHPFSANWPWKDAVEYPAQIDERVNRRTRQLDSPPRLYGYRVPIIARNSRTQSLKKSTC